MQKKERKEMHARIYLGALLFFVLLFLPFPAMAAEIYEVKQENYIAWNNLPTIQTTDEKGYYPIVDMGSYGANLTNDMSLGDGYYNSMHYYSDTRITYQKKIRVTPGMEINLTGTLKDMGEGGANISAMGKMSWNVMEWNSSGGFLWDSGWIATDETYTVGLDARGKNSSWGIDYSVGSRDTVEYITILFRFVDESGYDGAGYVPITPENVAEYFPNLFICYKSFTYTVDYGGYGTNTTVKRLGCEAIGLRLSGESNRPGYEIEWKIISNSALAQNGSSTKSYKASEMNEWLSNGYFYNVLFGDVTFQAVYYPKEYKVTYHSNGGDTTAVTRTYLYGEAIDLSLVARRAGYVFVGWSLLQGARVPLKDYTMMAGDVTMYAVYSIEVSDIENHRYPSYTPTEDITDDEVYLRVWLKEEASVCKYYPLQYVADVGSMAYQYILPEVDVSTFVRGRIYCYQLIAWDNAGNKKVLYEGSSDGSKIEEPEEAKTYKQTVEHYKYDARNKVWKWFAETSVRVVEGKTFTPAYTSPPVGYQAERMDAGGVVYADRIYKAYYRPIEYQVTFDARGGECSVLSKGVAYEDYYGTLPIPVKEGCVFAGWNTKADGSGKMITSGDIYTTASDGTLYAQYRTNTYTIIYDANGGSGSMDGTTLAYGVERKLSQNKFYLEGYTFVGWAEAPEGAVKYSDMASVKNLSLIDGDVVYLYAVYRKEIRVTFVEMRDTGQVSTTISNEVYHTNPQMSIVASKRGNWTGWEQVGWSNLTSATGNVSVLEGGTFWTDKDVTLYAIYTKEVSVRYDTNGSEAIYDSLSLVCYYNASGNASYPCLSLADAPKFSQHSFVRWELTEGIVKDETGATRTSCQPGERMQIVQNTVFIAVWDAFPELEVYHRYFTLEEAMSGTITQEKLLENVRGKDKEDGTLENGRAVWVVNYDASVFLQMDTEQEVEIMYQATDSFGNTVTKQATISIIDTTAKRVPQKRYVRFISPDFLWDDTGVLRPFAEGGLEETSIWRTNALYQDLLQKTLAYTGENKETWVFTKKDIDEIKDYTRHYGYVLEALDVFFELFEKCKEAFIP